MYVKEKYFKNISISFYFVNWMTCAFLLLMISITNIMAWFFVGSWTFFRIDSFVKRLVNIITLCIFYCWTKLLISSFFLFLVFWFIIWIALGFNFSLQQNSNKWTSWDRLPYMSEYELFYISHHFLHCTFSYKQCHTPLHELSHNE